MKISLYQIFKDRFMLSSWPKASVSKHPTRMVMPACRMSHHWARLWPVSFERPSAILRHGWLRQPTQDEVVGF
jgi:hypothetical protein